MTAYEQCKMKKVKNKNAGTVDRFRFYFLLLTFFIPAAGGCRQQMSDQPYHRPLEGSDFFADGRASRPLENGVVHRAQYLDTDPLATGLTPDEWTRVYARQGNASKAPDLATPTPIENREAAVTLPRYDQRAAGNPKVYVEGFPFAITSEDLDRGQERYTIYCAVCHGALGNGQGKIWERGYLKPTSFHTAPVGAHELTTQEVPATPLGYSRGYSLWDIKMPLREAPVGYYFEVITKGYGGMPSYSAQIPPADRWRIIAYVRALQYSQHATDLPPALADKVNAAGTGAATDTKKAGGHP
jgi:mono/diheme cytochrome c family protein